MPTLIDKFPDSFLFQEHNTTYGSNILQVTILASEWEPSNEGLSTMNRELAIQLAKVPFVKVTFFMPKCSDQHKKAAHSHGISILEAVRRPGLDELEWLIFPPDDLPIDVVVGHGVQLGHQAQFIRKSHKCKWVQFIHTDSEEAGIFNCERNSISTGEQKQKIEIELCQMADFVVGVGPKLAEVFRKYLRFCKKDVFEFTPGVFDVFASVQQVPDERKHYSVLLCGLGDVEDFELKGFDIAARSIAVLPDTHLLFVGAPQGRHEEIVKRFVRCGVPKNRLRVRGYLDLESLKRVFSEVDLVLMPSRAEGFGVTGLMALSAGLPVIVSKNSGFGEALSILTFGSSSVIDSEDPRAWTAAIKGIWNKDRKSRLDEVKVVRGSYDERYSWSKQCKDLSEKIFNLRNASKPLATLVNDLSGFVEKIFQHLDTRRKGAGHYEAIANCFGFDLSEIRSRFEKSVSGPSRAMVEAIVISHPEITVEIFAKVVEEKARRSDVADLLRAYDLDLLNDSV